MKAFQCLTAALLFMVAMPAGLAADPSPPPIRDLDLQAMLVRYGEASTRFYNGQPDAVKAMWSHADDVTLSGAAGGPTARGWREVSARLSWASAQFAGSRGSKTVEQIQTAVSGDFAYIVQYEYIRYRPPGQTTEARRDYRVTTLFRRESGGWRVVHRHADMQMERRDIR